MENKPKPLTLVTNRQKQLSRPAEILDAAQGESRDPAPPTPPHIRSRIRRFGELSTPGA